MINAKKIIASAVFFASLLGSLAFKPTIEKNKPLFEANRALNNLLSVEKYVEADSDKSPLNMVAGILDPKKHSDDEDEDRIFVPDKEKLAHYLDRESNTNSYIDAFKEIKADLFEGRSRAELFEFNQAINDCSQEAVESKLFLNSVFDNTYTAENIEEKMTELRLDITPSFMAPYNSLNFDFDEWLVDHDINLEYKEQILDGDFSAVPETIITTNPRRAAATMILVGGTYFAETGLISFITAKLGTLFSVISGAIKSFIAVVNIPWVGWVLAAAVIVALTVIIILNWSKIVECFEHIKAWFIYKASRFAAKITALFTDMANQAANKIANEVFNRVRTYVGVGKWTESSLKEQLNKCLHEGTQAISITQMIRDNKYVYLGRWANYYDGVNYVATARNNGGIYYDAPTSVTNYVNQKCNGDFWTLNMYYIELCLWSGKLFKLCTRPSNYYNINYDYWVESNPCAYAKELRLIHTNLYMPLFPRVTWYSDTPIVTTFRSL